MKNNDLRLQLSKLKNDQLLDLFNISLFAIHIARHDLRNFTAHTSTLAYKLKIEIEKDSADVSKSVYLESLSDVSHKLQGIANQTDQSIESLLDPFYPLDSDALLLSTPFHIVENLKKLRTYPEILVSDESPKSLELIFPTNIIYGIFSELIENVRKFVQNDGEVFIRWQMKGGKFQCEVHDNGLGIIPSIGNKFVPTDALPEDLLVKLRGGGLGIINRIITKAKGLFLLSNSKVLGGSLVYFEFPVISFKE